MPSPKPPVLLTLTLTLTLLVPAAIASPYKIKRIGTCCETDIRATDINDSGHVVGFSFVDSEDGGGFVYDGASTTHLEGLRPGDRTVALAINNAGDIVGYNIDAGTFERTAVLWRSGSMVDIGAALGATRSIARDINDNGVVVGQAGMDGPFSNGFIWDPVNGGQIVGTLDGRDGGTNRSVNNAGLVVGHSFFFGSPDQAHLVAPGNRGWESVLISAPFPAIGVAAAVNNNGVIVGHANTTFGPHTAAIFTLDTADPFIDLGTLAGAVSSEALDVNDAGSIVGSAGENPEWGTSHAFVLLDGRMRDLNDLVVDAAEEWEVLMEASAVNNRGEIVGHGITSDGNISAFLLVPSRFIRGDCNGDGNVNLSDATCMLDSLFAGAESPGCAAGLNVNGDAAVDLADPVSLLNFLFGGGSAPVAPFPDCGPGTLPADRVLGCATRLSCQ